MQLQTGHALIALTLGFFSSYLMAQTADIKIKDIPTSGSGKAIVIQDIEKAKDIKSCTVYEMVDGTDEIMGEPTYNPTSAREAWKSSCEKWKQEFKEMNKDNKLVILNCGSPRAHTEGQRSFYTSQAKYKMRIKMQEDK